MTSYHVMHYMTMVMCLFIVQENKRKEKKKRNQIKENR